MWAIGRDGSFENLGELWVGPEKPEGKITFSTGLRSFALLVTAESYYQVDQPSSLVIFQSGQANRREVRSAEISFSSLGTAPRIGIDTLANIAYAGKTPLDLLQAQKVFEIADRLEVQTHAPRLFQEAKLALQQATVMSANRARKGAQEYARRSVAASNDGIRITLRRLAAQELEEQIAQRQLEVADLERDARQARAEAQRVQQEAEATIRSLEEQRRTIEQQQARTERALAESRAELEEVDRSRSRLESAVGTLQQRENALKTSLQSLQVEIERLRTDRAELEGRLEGALSEIADTRSSAEGFIVNLPDILFGLNQATLKPEAQVVLAKMAGVLLLMNDLTVKVEGHTDSTGSAEYNLELSRKRADSVLDFLSDNGIESQRMTAVGYGMEEPIADNSTPEGRRKNRRVELIIADMQSQ